jgi:uncharacterized membrane protein
MLAKTFTAALALVALAGATFTAPTEASAREGRKGKAVAAAIVGLTGALIAGSVVAGQRGGYSEAGHRGRGYRDQRYPGERYGHGFRSRERHCFEKPISRWSRYHGETVIVGYRTVCR